MQTITIPTLNLYEFRCDEDLADSFYSNIFSQEIDWHTIKDANQPIPPKYGDIKTETYFFHDEWFNWAHECLQQVSAIHFASRTFKICDYWLTESKFGQSAFLHRHPFSIISGLYYFTDQENSFTTFVHKHEITQKYEFLIDVANRPLVKTTVKPEKGKLILFPSFLNHSYHMKDKNIRHTFAFNSFIDGVLSSQRSARLKIEVQKP